jgi:hypothetical protein
MSFLIWQVKTNLPHSLPKGKGNILLKCYYVWKVLTRKYMRLRIYFKCVKCLTLKNTVKFKIFADKLAVIILAVRKCPPTGCAKAFSHRQYYYHENFCPQIFTNDGTYNGYFITIDYILKIVAHAIVEVMEYVILQQWYMQ